MKILGLTGDIACGKSSVAQILKELGAAALDSDQLVRELYADANFALRVQALFERDIRDENGSIDRVKLGALVFGDADKLRELERVVHPAVALVRARKLEELELGNQGVVSVEAVKLLESGQGSICDEIWCVTCAPAVQLQRLMKRQNLSEAQARLRLQNQPTRVAKRNLAGDVPLVWIENNGSLEQLRALVVRQWTQFLA